MKNFVFIVIACCLLSACKVEMYSNLSEQNANLALAHLQANGIPAEKQVGEKGTYKLFVEEAQFSQAVELLAARGIPGKKFLNVNEIFDSGGIVASPVKEWARFNYAITQELSGTISSMQGVISADVHLANTHTENVFEEKAPATASVLVQMNSEYFRENLVPQIKRLVSFAIQDVSYERVNVVINHVAPISLKSQLVSMAGVEVHKENAFLVRILMIVSVLFLIAFAIFGFLFVVKKREINSGQFLTHET